MIIDLVVSRHSGCLPSGTVDVHGVPSAFAKKHGNHAVPNDESARGASPNRKPQIFTNDLALTEFFAGQFPVCLEYELDCLA